MGCKFKIISQCVRSCIEKTRKHIVSQNRSETLNNTSKLNADNDDESLYERVVDSELKSIESEPYFRAVDRSRAEEILQSRVDGSCLVRPFKENHETIKFIVSVYSAGQYFHLFVRRRFDGQFTLGQAKWDEKVFAHPAQIVRFYRLHKLTCSNRTTSVCIVLVPIN